MKGSYNPEKIVNNVVKWIGFFGEIGVIYYITCSRGLARICTDKEGTHLLAIVPIDKRVKSLEISVG